MGEGSSLCRPLRPGPEEDGTDSRGPGLGGGGPVGSEEVYPVPLEPVVRRDGDGALRTPETDHKPKSRSQGWCVLSLPPTLVPDREWV